MKDYIVSIGYKICGPDSLGLANSEAQRIGDLMRRAIDKALAEDKLKGEQLTTSYHHIEEEHMEHNAKRCEQCNTWTTDWWKPRCIDALIPGSDYEGRWLCDECIPDDACAP